MGAVQTILSMISMTTFKSLQMMWFDIKICPQHGLEGLQQSVKHLGWEYQILSLEHKINKQQQYTQTFTY